jgi:RNA-binding protein 15
VGNLEPDITERELRDLFGPYGRIESVDIKTQRVSGATYAFVKFLTINDAINAKNDMHGRKYGEYRLKIGFGRGAPTGKVWIGNLTCSTDLKEVQQELDRFGLIRKIDYQDGDNHAFIQLDSLDAAQAAIASLTGYRIRSSGRILKIDLCKPMHLRDDPDFHLRHQPEHSHSLDDSHAPSPAVFKRKVRDHDHHHHHHGSDSGIRRVKDEVGDLPPLKGERIVSSTSGGKGRGTREEIRSREYRKRLHSPPPGKDGYHHSSGRMRSDEINGENDYHSKRPRVVSESGGHKGERERERGSERDRERNGRSRDRGDRERDSRRTGADKEKREHKGKKEGDKGEKNDDNADGKDEKKSEKSEGKEEQKRPVLEPTLSDIVAAKDTALKLDSAPEQLAMETGAGGSEPTVPESLNDLAKLYPVAWRGNLVLKNTGFPTRMHLVGGDPAVAETLLRTREGKDYLVSLRITQRLRLEQPRLEEVNKRMVSAGPSGYCVLLALPGPTPSAPLSPETEFSMQLRPLKSLVSYLKQKEAAGIVALSGPEGSETASASVDKDVVGVLHAFPPCEFSQSHLLKIAPRLGEEPAKEDHIVVLLVKGNV